MATSGARVTTHGGPHSSNHRARGRRWPLDAHKDQADPPTPRPVSSLLGTGLRLYGAYLLAGVLAAGAAAVLVSVGGALGLVALFALVVGLFVLLGAVAATR